MIRFQLKELLNSSSDLLKEFLTWLRSIVSDSAHRHEDFDLGKTVEDMDDSNSGQ